MENNLEENCSCNCEVVVSKSAFKRKFGQDEYAEVKWEKQLEQLIQEKLIKQDKLPGVEEKLLYSRDKIFTCFN